MLIRSILAAVLCLTPCAALGQDLAQDSAQDDAPVDWTLLRLPEHKAVVATIDFSSGISLFARCQADVFDLMISGLPEASRQNRTREIGIQVGDDTAPTTFVWSVGTDRTTAFSRLPAMVARDLAKGGQLQVIIPSERNGGPRTRYVMDIEPSSQAIEQTLTECGLPLIDPREALSLGIEGNGQDGLPGVVVWTRMPRPTYPQAVGGRIPENGYVALSCLVDGGGRLNQCEIESEHPRGFNLGRSVQRSLPQARVRLSDSARERGSTLENRMIVFTFNFNLD